MVTDYEKLLNLKDFKGIRIVGTREMLEAIESPLK